MLLISLVTNIILITLLIMTVRNKAKDDAMLEASYLHIFGLLQQLEQERMDFKIWKDMYGSDLPDTCDSINTTDIIK